MKKINWRDFKIKDEQPNLIPNGWDSFEPYGSGDNYVEKQHQYYESDEVRLASIELSDTSTIDKSETYILRMKCHFGDGRDEFRLFSSPNAVQEGRMFRTLHYNENTKILEYEFEFINPADKINMLLINQLPTNLDSTSSIEWVSLSKKNNQHLVLEKTPLGNGLTRIQTWGGNNRTKMIINQGQSTQNENRIFSFYIKENKDYIEISLGNVYRKVNQDYVKIDFKGDGFVYNVARIGVVNINDNLDFIASDPQIVEGDKANPVLLINDLDDGREHVQVYGAYPDTKLISKEVQGFSGEPYQIKTDIENNGIEMSMDTTLGDKSIDINKGSNSISHTGELQGQHIIIELGAKDE